MSDNENNQSGESSASTATIVDKGDVRIEYVAITEGDFGGFNYAVPQIKDLAAGVRHFTSQSQNGKDGEDIIVALVNNALLRNMRQRATNRLTAPDKVDGVQQSLAQKTEWKAQKIALLQDSDKSKHIIVDEDEAFSYVPGEREVDSISGLQSQEKKLRKAINDLGLAIKNAKSNADTEAETKLTDEFRIQYAKHKAVTEEISKRQANELDDLKSLLGV